MGGQVKWFLEEHLGNPIPSPAIIEKIGNRFRRDVKAFAAANQVPLLALKKPDRSRWDDRKLDHVRPYLDAAERDGRFGVVAIVVAQEFQWVFNATKHTGAGGGIWFEFTKAERRVGIYYFYVLDPEFGPGFIKICTYFPYPAKVWLNGHEWAKRQADHAGIDYRALANGFATCDDPDALQAICDRFGPADVQGFFDRWIDVIPTPFTAADRAAGYWWELSMRQVEVSKTLVFDDPRRARCVLRSARHRQHRHRPSRTGQRRVRAPPASAAPHQAPAPDPHLHPRHRRPHRLPVQAQPGQAIPQGRESAAHRDRHQQTSRPRRSWPGSSTCPNSSPRPAPSTAVCYLWNVPVRVVPSALRSSSASTSPTTERANEPEPCASGTHAPWP